MKFLRNQTFLRREDDKMKKLRQKVQQFKVGSCRGSVGGMVASDARGPRFESSHRQTFILDIYLFTVNCVEKKKMKKTEAGNDPFLKLLM